MTFQFDKLIDLINNSRRRGSHDIILTYLPAVVLRFNPASAGSPLDFLVKNNSAKSPSSMLKKSSSSSSSATLNPKLI